MLMSVKDAAKVLGLSIYEIRQGIHEGRYRGYWTRNHKRLLVDPEILQADIRAEMEKAQQEAKEAYYERFPYRRA